MNIKTSLYCSSKWATFLLVFNEKDICIDAPPIAKWCLGKTKPVLRKYWKNRRFEVLDQ